MVGSAISRRRHHVCCAALRQEPLNSYLRAQDGPYCFIHGQRNDDRGATVEGLRPYLPLKVEIGMPLADWFAADVLAYIEEHHLTLSSQYAEGFRDSIECLVCPLPFTAERARNMRRHHPKLLPIVHGAINDACHQTIAAVASLQATQSAAEPP